MEQQLVKALIARFPDLEGKVRVARPMRVFLEPLERERFYEVIAFLHDELGLTRGHNVVGTDEGQNLGFLYLVSGADNIIVALRTFAPKAAPHIRSMTAPYPSFVLFERELCDLFGAIVEGLPAGPRYPLPDGWPSGQWPLRKEWNPAYFNRETLAYEPPEEAEHAIASDAEPPPTDAAPTADVADAADAAHIADEFPADAADAAHIADESPADAADAADALADNRVTIPIGPQHPSLDEPGSFTITLKGERVEGAVIGIGYNHRGLEKTCESRTYVQGLYIIERVCGICSHAHTNAYCMAIEQLAGVEAPARAEYIRMIVAELERLHSHLLWLGVAGHEIGFDTLFMLSWRDRERVLDLLSVLGGNRINYGVNCLGGVRRDIDAGMRAEILAAMDFLEKEISYYRDVAVTETTLIARLSGVGVLSREDCLYYGATGPVSRAAGLAADVRRDEPYGAYRHIPVNVITDSHADVFGRTIVRVCEMLESIRLIREALERMPEGPIAVRVPRRIPAGEAIIRVEAPRGEDIHYVRANGSDMPDRVRVRAPTECNWHGMQHMLEGGYLSDVPITIAAIDPCYSCTDRAIELRQADGSREALDWKTLRAYGVDFYRRRGVDCSRIRL